MIRKYSVLALFTLLLVTASDPFFGIQLSLRPVPKEQPGDVKELPWMSTEAFRPYLSDYDKRVADAFKVKRFYYPNVHFWFLIYTQFGSDQVVIHDKSNLNLIYKVLDFSSLYEKKLSRNTIYVLQQKLSEEKIDELKSDLDELAMSPFSNSPSSKKILLSLKQAGIGLPVTASDRSIFFNRLKHNLRTQTGQKNFIRDGITRSLPYQNFLGKYFTDRKLPKELLAIPFLESSFNPRAHSKVNALGVWQFMPLIASYYVPKRTPTSDYRSNIGVSSIAAAHLMSENFKIMKSWDLAVTAYNSGTKHLLHSKRKMKDPGADLEAIIKHSDSQSFGFASKNFYSEFLALTYTLAYREELFSHLHDHDREDVDQDLRFYLTKCTLTLPRILSENQLNDIHFHNHHLRELQRPLGRGSILTTKGELPRGKFFLVAYKDLLRIKPKDWHRLLGRQSCSTR
jgi:membrane-bound lytic murein transglycosylase D